MKNQIKTSILCLGLLMVTFACQNDDIAIENENVSDLISYKKLSLSQINKLQPVVNNLKKIKPKTPIGSLARDFSFLSLDSLDTNNIIEYTNSTGYTTYTFKFNGLENSTNFENLHLLETDDGFIGYILSFEPNDEWFTSQSNLTPEGEIVVDFANFQGDITKYSLEREIIWTTKEEEATRQMHARTGGFIEVCVFSVVPSCDYGGQLHPWGTNCTGNMTFETIETCQTVWSSGGSGSGNNNGSNSGNNGGSGNNGDDDCRTSGTSIVGEQPLGGIADGCTPNSDTGVDTTNGIAMIAFELDQILNGDDSYEVDNTLSSDNTLSFQTIEVFEAFYDDLFEQETEETDVESTSDLSGETETKYFGYNFTGGMLSTEIKLELVVTIPENTPCECMEVVSATSYMIGNTSFFEWEQMGDYWTESSDNGEEITVFTRGILEMGVTIQGVPLRVEILVTFVQVFNVNTGTLISYEVISD